MDDIENIVRNAPDISEFQRKVYLETIKIPIGQTITYGELARRIGCKSPQAVGQALRKNPFAPFVPCHRVVAANGHLGGYFGAVSGPVLDKKRILLEEEAKLASNI